MNRRKITVATGTFWHTSENITKLKPDEIFVFGSNLSGIHGKGAAKLAVDKFGAKRGQWFGQVGQTFAIPTRGKWIASKKTFEPMDLGAMGERVYDFLNHAKCHPEFIFLVTKVGCGNAGFSTQQMGRLFALFGSIPGNVSLPKEFWAAVL